MIKEIPILGLDGYYISTDGVIYSNRQGKNNYIISQQYDKDGYKSVTLFCSIEKKRKKFQVHRLVAITFIPNPNNLQYVNHIDAVRDNNNVYNLEWCTSSYNSKYSYMLNNRNQVG